MNRTQAFYRSEDQFEDRLDEMGVTRESVEDDHRKALIVERYLDQQIGEMPVSDRDIRQYYEANQSMFVWKDATRTRHILIRVPSGASLDERIKAFEKAKEIRGRLNAGEDFSTLARAYSEDGETASLGGDLGYVEEGRLAPEYEKAAGTLQNGEISEVAKTSFGYHIIQLLGRRKGGDTKTLDEVKDIVRLLVARDRRTQQEKRIVEELRRHAMLRYEGS
jgi:foldase protein PrsA